MNPQSKVYLAGHRGLVGSALVRLLRARGYANLVLRTHSELDLTDQGATREFFARERPEYVVLAAARVGGIGANLAYPAQFLRENLLIAANVLDAAYQSGCKKLMVLGSSCIYPRLAPQPMSEDCLLTGPLEASNEPYAIAKIATVRLARCYHRQFGFPTLSVMPTNLYGPEDNFDLQDSHVLPALIRRFDDAVRGGVDCVRLWGTGEARREFLHADDLAEAILFLMLHHEDPEILNVGTGEDLSIRDLAGLVAQVVGYTGRIEFDPSRPDGTPRKLLCVDRLSALGWRPRIPLREGLEQTYRWYCEHRVRVRGLAGPVR